MNIGLGKTQITEQIRVSSAAIFYEHTDWGIPYYQYETFIFSDDPKFKTRMFIWDTSGGKDINKNLSELTKRAHRRIAKIMLSKNLKELNP